MARPHGVAWRAHTVACVCYQARCEWVFQIHHWKALKYSCLLHVSPNPLSVHRVIAHLGQIRQRSWARTPGGNRSSHTQPPGVSAAGVGPLRIQMELNSSGAAPALRMGFCRLIVGSPSAVQCSRSAACPRSTEQENSIKRIYTAI
jgi:hypothetical protein